MITGNETRESLTSLVASIASDLKTGEKELSDIADDLQEATDICIALADAE